MKCYYCRKETKNCVYVTGPRGEKKHLAICDWCRKHVVKKGESK